MSEKEIFELILAPGFSTAKTVTSVSGRGVGMDVVTSSIESFGGTVEIAEHQGIRHHHHPEAAADAGHH